MAPSGTIWPVFSWLAGVLKKSLKKRNSEHVMNLNQLINVVPEEYNITIKQTMMELALVEQESQGKEQTKRSPVHYSTVSNLPSDY